MSEVVQHMSADDARRLTERIRITAHNYAEARDKLVALVQEAKDGNAHEALGYESWTAYLSETLGAEPMRLARDDRQDMVRVLSAEGMSTRAIASVVGVDQKTVSNDRRAQREREEFSSPAPAAPVTGLDGKTYTRPEPKEEEVKTLTRPPQTSPGRKKKDLPIVRNVVDSIGVYVIAVDAMLTYGFDDSITSEEAGVITADLSRHLSTLNKLNRQLRNRQEQS